MKVDDIVRMLNAVGIDTSKVKLNAAGTWLKVPCPFAGFRSEHRSSVDKNPSCGFRISNGMSAFNCFTCHESGDLMHFVWGMQRRLGRDLKSAASIVHKYNQMSEQDFAFRIESDGEDGQYSVLKKRIRRANYAFSSTTPDIFFKPGEDNRLHVDRLNLPALAETELDLFSDLDEEAMSYCHRRGLTSETIKIWDIRWHPTNRRIVIPIRDHKKLLVGISGRTIDSDVKPKYLHSFDYKRDCYLYGEHMLLPGNTGIITEGFLDVHILWQFGYLNAVGLLGTHFSKFQRDKVLQFFNRVVIFMDGDAAGRDAAAKIKDSLTGHIPLKIINIDEGLDPGSANKIKLLELLGDPEKFQEKELTT
jgi:5S rRNA maturation endonuclease (ribonuclease M5)